ncbi:hypothetical protein EAO70_20765 [Streptomyces sp. adm13(2018)]|uniref:hypothetical protein n=1 Tax=Streptomyces sp. adm13(2018) TaxID=2479007 RepID=UPI0011CDE816|nr:hypothetical protein [Streptomyces sp. adm13(2018)]TXS14017.1 hypothetical protein EAO70_20765 [Streptomyces sp. adm13(2018)]
MSAREDSTRREDLTFMLLHGGAASGSIAQRVVDNAVAEALAEQAGELEMLRAQVAELEAAAEKVAGFCAARAEYVDNLRGCSPSNNRDYYRWSGHAEARRQLSQLLGLPVGWPAEDNATCSSCGNPKKKLHRRLVCLSCAASVPQQRGEAS